MYIKLVEINTPGPNLSDKRNLHLTLTNSVI